MGCSTHLMQFVDELRSSKRVDQTNDLLEELVRIDRFTFLVVGWDDTMRRKSKETVDEVAAS